MELQVNNAENDAIKAREKCENSAIKIEKISAKSRERGRMEAGVRFLRADLCRSFNRA
jgi:hypothetical protein